MADSKVFVEALVLGFSPSAADSSKTSLNVVDKLPMIFDFGPHPRAWFDRHLPPTTFATEAEARAKVDDLIARAKGIVRVAQKLGHPADLGRAEMLFGRDFDGKHFGGYEVTPYVQWEAELAEEQRVDNVVANEQLAQADSEALAAQAKADAIRAEVKPMAPRQTASSSKWVAAGHKVQVYRREDGTESFRGRSDGKVSASFDTLEQAVAWVEGDREPGKVSEDRTAALESMRDVVVRS